jgi:glycosyltransferase involved in cell wall biosynthesis
MKVLLIHNYYQLTGGEDAVFANEMALLKKNGHDVFIYTVDNASITTVFAKLCLLFNITFSFSQYRKVKKTLQTELPAVVHVHNYFPLISPAVFYACKKSGIPVVHTLHNYRAICPTALLMHDGKINETSLKGSTWWTVTKRVYRNSFIGSLALACMAELHKLLGTWQTKVDGFIALTEFSRQKYIEAGWPAEKILVKPNFIEDPFDTATTLRKVGGYALYVGRLSEEKGINILLDAWTSVDLPLKVIGDGPLKSSVESNALASVVYLGLKKKDEVLALIKNADFIIMPSTWYETFGMVIIEAFACGTPVLASRLGSLQTIIVDDVTGLHFEAGNPVDLAEKAQWMVDNPAVVKQMGANARKEYLAKYTPEKNLTLLMDIYQQAIMECKNDGP